MIYAAFFARHDLGSDANEANPNSTLWTPALHRTLLVQITHCHPCKPADYALSLNIGSEFALTRSHTSAKQKGDVTTFFAIQVHSPADGDGKKRISINFQSRMTKVENRRGGRQIPVHTRPSSPVFVWNYIETKLVAAFQPQNALRTHKNVMRNFPKHHLSRCRPVEGAQITYISRPPKHTIIHSFEEVFTADL